MRPGGYPCAIVACGILMACDTSHRPASETAGGGDGCNIQITVPAQQNRKIDVLLVVDDSPGMRALGPTMDRELPKLGTALGSIPHANIHIAVVSSSMRNGSDCSLPGPRDAGGRFQAPDACAAFTGEKVLQVGSAAQNFTGSLSDAVGCMAHIGFSGCPFPQPLAAARLALEKASDSTDPDNKGFLRSGAELAVVFLTNHDDCSLAADSPLLDSTPMTPADTLGAFDIYRCFEFGLSCQGRNLPHALDVGITETRNACTPTEDGIFLSRVGDFVGYLKTLKAPELLSVSVMGGDSSGELVASGELQQLADGRTYSQPSIRPACSTDSGAVGAPTPRLTKLVTDLSGVQLPSCANTLAPLLTELQGLSATGLGISCLSEMPRFSADGNPDCEAADVTVDAEGTRVARPLPFCSGGSFPCWRTADEPRCSGLAAEVCTDAICAPRFTDVMTTTVLRCQPPNPC